MTSCVGVIERHHASARSRTQAVDLGSGTPPQVSAYKMPEHLENACPPVPHPRAASVLDADAHDVQATAPLDRAGIGVGHCAPIPALMPRHREAPRGSQPPHRRLQGADESDEACETAPAVEPLGFAVNRLLHAKHTIRGPAATKCDADRVREQRGT
jgi:hypothetical protein